ncbi:hypothetical protein P3L10_018694 [Capsicum annuum]
MMDTSSRSEDDLTHQLTIIICHNENLMRQERNGAPTHITSEFSQLLQFYITTFFIMICRTTKSYAKIR